MSLLGILGALWLGVLATVSPCPLASNLAALSYVAQAAEGRRALRRALFYGAGRMGAHAAAGALLLAGATTVPQIRAFVAAELIRFIGPLLLILGVFLMGWVRIDLPDGGKGRLARRVPPGDAGALALGILLSLLPCPETAALFFGGLIPLALSANSAYLYPALFGLGTALPMALLGVLLASGARALSVGLLRLGALEALLRQISGVLLTLIYTYGLF